jgi:hypothetical protein
MRDLMRHVEDKSNLRRNGQCTMHPSEMCSLYEVSQVEELCEFALLSSPFSTSVFFKFVFYFHCTANIRHRT